MPLCLEEAEACWQWHLISICRCVVESILSSCSSCGIVTTLLQWVVKTAQRITGSSLPTISDIFSSRSRKKPSCIIRDSTCPANRLFSSSLQAGGYAASRPERPGWEIASSWVLWDWQILLIRTLLQFETNKFSTLGLTILHSLNQLLLWLLVFHIRALLKLEPTWPPFLSFRFFISLILVLAFCSLHTYI